MLFLSLADACRLLGIDPKTLHRWLAHAHLCLQPHPGDARKHGLSEDHLHLLARLHQRALPTLPPETTAPVSAARPPLPTELLALPTTLGALQAQLTALQQQVADLTHLLQQHAHQPAIPAAPAQQAMAAKPPREPTHVLPLVEYGSQGHYVVICPKQGLLALEPDSSAWFAWLATQSSFRGCRAHRVV